MPTGGGKSLCYQIPALALSGLCIVVSPLIALMDDQVNALKQLGVSAASLHSNVPHEEKLRIDEKMREGSLKLLYVSPERIRTPEFIEFLKTKQINLFAIDEAHCVSIWGNDFRPDYVELKSIKSDFPEVPVIALTATADAITQDDIEKQLRLHKPDRFVSSFERKNISVICRPGQERVKQIYQFISKHPKEAGIIYCLSRKGTEQMCAKLKERGIRAGYYHAGCSAEHRQLIQSEFQADDLDVVCATIAFGMGIDKPNIRYVIHYNMPKNIEGYYQEIGRAGRDGDPSEALLFYSWADMSQLKGFIDDSDANEHFKNVQNAKLDRMWQYANTQSCRTKLVLNYFGEYRSQSCGHCDNCISPATLIDGTAYAQMAISGIIRTHERLTLPLLMDLLKGSAKQEILRMGLDKIKTYGAGRIVPYPDWRHYLNQMIDQGIIRLDLTDNSRLKLTPLSMKVIIRELPISLTEYKREEVVSKKKKSYSADIPSDFDNDFFQILRGWRTKKAKEAKVPPYVIFSDKTLKQIAALLPSDKNSLLNVDGIGKVKLESYGEDILEMVNRQIQA